MKINRYKRVHKILKYYSINFGFRKPYQVLIDGTICVAALKNKINISEQFSKYLDGDVKLLTTQCIVKEMEKLGNETIGGLFIIKKFGTHRCGHEKSPVTAAECILHMVTSENGRYIVATQDREVQKKIRKVGGIPLLYFHIQTPNLEAPSDFTKKVVSKKLLNTTQISDYEKSKLSTLNAEEKVEEIVRKKRKKKGGPNPLSCKKKKKKVEEHSTPKNENPNKKKKKRKRSRLEKKIKSEIMASLNS